MSVKAVLSSYSVRTPSFLYTHGLNGLSVRQIRKYDISDLSYDGAVSMDTTADDISRHNSVAIGHGYLFGLNGTGAMSYNGSPAVIAVNLTTGVGSNLGNPISGLDGYVSIIDENADYFVVWYGVSATEIYLVRYDKQTLSVAATFGPFTCNSDSRKGGGLFVGPDDRYYAGNFSGHLTGVPKTVDSASDTAFNPTIYNTYNPTAFHVDYTAMETEFYSFSTYLLRKTVFASSGGAVITQGSVNSIDTRTVGNYHIADGGAFGPSKNPYWMGALLLNGYLYGVSDDSSDYSGSEVPEITKINHDTLYYVSSSGLIPFSTAACRGSSLGADWS
jgi:hypothetical protein